VTRDVTGDVTRDVTGTSRHGSARHPLANPVAGWAIATSVYFLAVLNRSSLGVAALQAERRFDISPAQLSTFVILQVGIYAAMQIPAGVLVDRFGPRRLLVTAALLMGGAQLIFSLVASYPLALFARGLLGCGDALTFVSVLRFSIGRFSPKRYPIVVSLSGLIGIVGNLLATLPLTFALQQFGWAWAFALMAVTTLITGALVFVLLPEDVPAHAGLTLATLVGQGKEVGGRIVASWSRPGTRLGFWLHFACMSTTTALAVLWGHPYLVDGLGFSTTAASATLLVSVVTAGVSIVAIGWLTSLRPVLRVPLAMAFCVLTLAGWAVVLLQPPADVSHGYAAALVCFSAIGGPASSIAFALARDYNGPAVVGTASGLVNVGGFLATILAATAAGAVLDVAGTSPADYRWAIASMLGVQVFGTAQMARWYLRARAANLVAVDEGLAVPVPITRRRWDRVAGRS
jgi:MFS family permease